MVLDYSNRYVISSLVTYSVLVTIKVWAGPQIQVSVELGRQVNEFRDWAMVKGRCRLQSV